MNKFPNLSKKSPAKDNKTEVHKYLKEFINNGLVPYCENGLVMLQRKQIQDDPMVVRELALCLKELKKVYNQYSVNGRFTFNESAQ